MYLHVECVSRWLLLFTSMLSPCHGGCFFLPQFWFNEMHGGDFYVPPCWFHEMVAASMYSMLIPWHRVCYCASMLIQWDAWWRLLCTSMLIPWDGESFCVPPCWIHYTVDAWWPLWLTHYGGCFYLMLIPRWWMIHCIRPCWFQDGISLDPPQISCGSKMADVWKRNPEVGWL